MKVIWTEPAIAELEAVYDFLTLSNPAAAHRLVEELVLAADGLADFPHRGRNGRLPGTRELVAVRPYLIVYRVENEAVLILRIWHSAQNRPE